MALRIRNAKAEKLARELDLLIHRAQIEIVAMNADQAELARIAWRKYGKGNFRQA